MKKSLRQKLINDLKRDEGFRKSPYECSKGHLTIGYGRNLDAKGITEEEAKILLINDIVDAEMDLEQVLPGAESLGENRHRALINMVYNLGINRFIGFKKMLKAINEGDFDRAADEMRNSLWHKQVGSRVERLAELMRKD